MVGEYQRLLADYHHALDVIDRLAAENTRLRTIMSTPPGRVPAAEPCNGWAARDARAAPRLAR